MKRRFGLLAAWVLALSLIAPRSSQAADPYTPLWLYQGNWRMEQKTSDAADPVVQLSNTCALVGKYFACQQTVNGVVGALLVFAPEEEMGHYHTQAILPDGLATGRGELVIEGDRWTYDGKGQEEGGKTTYQRTTNSFTGKDRIHFEQLESTDGQHWTVKKSGNEVRTAP